jgi:hypothetical protein
MWHAQVYFSLRNNDSDLVVRAIRKQDTGDSHIIELIPREKMEGDLPAVLIEGHTHWLNLSTSVIEIRPLDGLWETSSENWKIDCTPGKYRLQKGNEFLVDIRSQSWDMISNLLRPFDTPQNLLVSVSPIDSSQPMSSLQLSVVLPRYGLSFYADEDGDLQSYNMRGMVYDENQSVGTLFGLVNRLVLRPKIGDVHAVELIPRCILIPEGEISFKMDGHHVRVEIDTHRLALGRVTYQTFRVDTDMGCLTGNVSLTNKLYCAYLHALTSGCGADPLTGRSGTEEALSGLRSASCWSIIKFGSREAELLSLIASIYPTRTWYPEHLKCMQKVEWLNLPASAQHHELYVVAKGIKEHCERVLLFQDGQSSALFQSFPLHEENLLQRSALRAAYLFPSEFSGQPSGANLDVRYSARDLVEVASGEQRVYTAATVVHHRTANATTTNILSMVESWTESVSGDTTLSLQYDRSWLAPDLPLIWLKAYKLLRGNDERKWFRLLFSLPAMAYASSQLTELVHVFVAFASDPHFGLEDPPHYGSYSLSEGYQPSAADLRSFVSDCAYSFESSPESSEPARYAESTYDLQERRVRMYNSRRNADTDATVQQLLNAWPCETPPRCSLNSGLYNVPDLTSNVQRNFSSCYRNLKLKEHLARVQDVLKNVSSQASPNPTLQYSFQPSQSTPSRTCCSLSVDQLFARPAPFLPAHGRLSPYIADDGDTSLSGSVPGGLPNSDSHDVANLAPRIHSYFSNYYRNLKLPRLFSSFIPRFLRPASSLQTHDILSRYAADVGNTSPRSSTSLHQLIATVEANAAVDPFQRQYVSALHTSAECFGNELSLVAHGATELPAVETLVTHYARCRASYIEGLDYVKQRLAPSNQSEQALEQSGQWPRITAHALFRSLGSSSPIILSDDWKKCLTRLTLLALELQRARRLLQLHVDNLREELRRELQNEGCDGWNAESHPDWLLIQVCFSCDACIYQLTLHPLLTSAAKQLFGSSRSG